MAIIVIFFIFYFLQSIVGIYFNSILSWKDHFANLNKSIQSCFYQHKLLFIRYTQTNDSFLCFKILSLTIVPILSYCILLYLHQSDHKICSIVNDSGNVICDEQSICNAFNIFYINITSSLKNNHLYNYTSVLNFKRINDNVFKISWFKWD